MQERVRRKRWSMEGRGGGGGGCGVGQRSHLDTRHTKHETRGVAKCNSRAKLLNHPLLVLRVLLVRQLLLEALHRLTPRQQPLDLLQDGIELCLSCPRNARAQTSQTIVLQNAQNAQAREPRALTSHRVRCPASGCLSPCSSTWAPTTSLWTLVNSLHGTPRTSEPQASEPTAVMGFLPSKLYHWPLAAAGVTSSSAAASADSRSTIARAISQE